MSSDAILRVEWLPGTDHLLGTCHCGARHRGQDPVAMWEWLHAHPDHPLPVSRKPSHHDR